jgi:hypothetical protein
MKKPVLAFAALCLFAPLVLAAPAAKSLDSYWADSGKSFPAAGQFSKPQAWAPGQYVVTGTTVKGKRDSVATTLVVRKEEGGWVIESVGVDKKGKESVSQMLLAGFDTAMTTGDASKIELVWMKTLDKDGKISVIEGPAIAMIKGLMKSTWEKLVVKVEAPTEGGAVKVPAGGFAGTSHIKSTSKVMGQTIEAETWFNSAVPVNGMVKTATTDGKTVTELLAFGTDGKPRIP